MPLCNAWPHTHTHNAYIHTVICIYTHVHDSNIYIYIYIIIYLYIYKYISRNHVPISTYYGYFHSISGQVYQRMCIYIGLSSCGRGTVTGSTLHQWSQLTLNLDHVQHGTSHIQRHRDKRGDLFKENKRFPVFLFQVVKSTNEGETVDNHHKEKNKNLVKTEEKKISGIKSNSTAIPFFATWKKKQDAATYL